MKIKPDVTIVEKQEGIDPFGLRYPRYLPLPGRGH